VRAPPASTEDRGRSTRVGVAAAGLMSLGDLGSLDLGEPPLDTSSTTDRTDDDWSPRRFRDELAERFSAAWWSRAEAFPASGSRLSLAFSPPGVAAAVVDGDEDDEQVPVVAPPPVSATTTLSLRRRLGAGLLCRATNCAGSCCVPEVPCVGLRGVPNCTGSAAGGAGLLCRVINCAGSAACWTAWCAELRRKSRVLDCAG